ncbi:PREDICTED: prostate and testis expressed protein 1 [Myotis brandtii]|uniref:prostate and testis expressed protein 1 n=1 Tax=Myotis brandtii TaxID=109478 RepID=UPI00070438E9|nr:PREDICTED: prostate and testis expressed protein 1 [Myotis brandtii]
MDRPLLRGLPVLLCCFRVLSGSFTNREYAGNYQQHLYIEKSKFFDTVQCKMCHIMFPGQRCYRGRGICHATPEEACTVGRISKSDGTLWLIFAGCLKNCANVNNIRWSIYLVDFRCCRSSDFCNELI